MWRVQVLGGLALRRGDAVVTRFESRKVGALLAWLALHMDRTTAREELIDLCWPEEDLAVGRQRLRQALSSLRRQLEPPGMDAGSVLLADRIAVRLNPDAVECDGVEFERLCRARRFAEARDHYKGDLLPGWYDDWVHDERVRLSALFESLPAAPAPGSKQQEEQAARGAPESSSPPRAAAPTVTLPPYVTALFGRDEELRRLAAILDLNRLVTITGFGGTGKTRLAVETARRLASRFDPVAFAPLADCSAPEQIVDRLRAALHLPRTDSVPLDQIAEVLEAKRPLLVLDNFEQLASPAGAEAVRGLLHRLPGLTCLLTSRRRLGVEGEREFPLSPLPLPARDEGLVATAACASAALFVDRAQAARPGFQITPRNRADVAAVCAALEGIPLSIEIAASRIRRLPVAEMARQIEDRLRWLERSGPAADRTPRQRSLTGILDWSWRLLEVDRQRFLARLAVFRGGWTAPYADYVCGVDGSAGLLAELVDDSLVLRLESGTGSRFGLLEIVRQYCLEKLEPGAAAEARRRHRALVLDLCRRKGARTRLAAEEADNLRAALDSAVEDGDVEGALDLLAAGGERWLAVLGAGATLDACRRALALDGAGLSGRSAVHALSVEAALLGAGTDIARESALQGLAEAGSATAPRAVALIALARVELAHSSGTDRAAVLLEEAVALARAHNAGRLAGAALRELGRISNRRGEYALALDQLNEAVRLLEAGGDEAGAIQALDNMANTSVLSGDLDRAIETYRECQRQALAAGDLVHHAKLYQNLAALVARKGEWAEALTLGRECIRLCHGFGNAFMVGHALWNLAEALAMTGDEGTAARIIGFTQCYWVERYGELTSEDHSYLDSLRRRMIQALGPDRVDSIWRAGARLTLHEAVDLALSSASRVASPE